MAATAPNSTFLQQGRKRKKEAEGKINSSFIREEIFSQSPPHPPVAARDKRKQMSGD